MVSENRSQSPLLPRQIHTDNFHPAISVFLPYPYRRTGKCNCWTDDNISDENPKTVRMSGSESLPDLLLTHTHRTYPGTGNLRSHGPARPPETKMLLSSHYKRLRYIPICRPAHPVCNSIPPGGKSHHVDKYSGRIPRPCKHASDSGNLCHYSSPPDIRSCPDTSSHLKKCSTIL